MELFASFWIRSKVREVERQSKKIVHWDEKEAEVVGMKNGEVEIQDFEFVKAIEERIQISEIIFLSVDNGARKIQIILFFCGICNLGEVSIQDRVTNRPQFHDKILGCLSGAFYLWNQCFSCVKFERRNECSTS